MAITVMMYKGHIFYENTSPFLLLGINGLFFDLVLLVLWDKIIKIALRLNKLHFIDSLEIKPV